MIETDYLTRQDDGLDRVIFPQNLDNQLPQVNRVNKLPERPPGSVHNQLSAGLGGNVCLVDEARQDVPGLDVEVVKRTEHVRRNDWSEVAAVLFVVSSVLDVDEALGVAVAEVGRVRWTVVDLSTRPKIIWISWKEFSWKICAKHEKVRGKERM